MLKRMGTKELNHISPSLQPEVVPSFREKKNGESGTETQRRINSFKCINRMKCKMKEMRDRREVTFFFPP